MNSEREPEPEDGPPNVGAATNYFEMKLIASGDKEENSYVSKNDESFQSFDDQPSQI